MEPGRRGSAEGHWRNDLVQVAPPHLRRMRARGDDEGSHETSTDCA
jgi:hypothetical protein